MRKPAEVMKLMTALIMVGFFEDRKHKSEKGKSRDTNRLGSCCLFEIKKGQLSRIWNVSHLSSPQLGKIQSAQLLRPNLKACAGRQSYPNEVYNKRQWCSYWCVGFGTKDSEKQRETELCNFWHKTLVS